MARALLCTTIVLAAAVAVAETRKPGGSAKDDPRPGMRWAETTPAAGGKKVTLLAEGRETGAFELAPGGTIELKVNGPTRVLVYSRLSFKSRTSKDCGYSYGIALDGGAAAKAGFKGAPHKTATWKESKSIPGTQDARVIEVLDGPHTLTFTLDKAKKSKVALRFLVEEPRPAKGAGGAATKKSTGWKIGGVYRFKLGYDDNIWRFNDNTLHNVEHFNDNTDTFNDIDRAWDWYMVNQISVDFRHGTGAGSWTVGAEVTDRYYVENHRKSYDELEMSLKHQISSDVLYKYYAAWAPDRFVRNLNSEDIPGSDATAAHFDDYRMGLRFWYRIVKGLSATFTYEWEQKDYNSKFNERDMFLHHYVLGLRYSPVEFLTFDVDFEHVHARARAKQFEVDNSYRENGPRLGVDFNYKGILAGVAYRYEWREYTTLNDASAFPRDPHGDRWDRRHVWRFMAGYAVTADTTITIEYQRTKKTARLANRQESDDVRDVDEALEYDANTWELTVEQKF